jgi:hypothetical protein
MLTFRSLPSVLIFLFLSCFRMARLKTTPRKKTGPQGVPCHQLATRGDGASSSCNPNLDSQAEVTRLTSEIERLKRNMHFWKQCQNESLEKETEARAHVRELELYVTHLEQYNTKRIKMPKRGVNWAFLKINCKN